MNAGEMLRNLRVRLNDTEEPYRLSKELLLSWLQGAYMKIQLESQEWWFLRQRGKIFMTEAGMAEYDLPAVKEVNPGSLYYVRAGTSAHQPLWTQDYQDWAVEEASGSQTSGPPRWLIHTPAKKWLLDPTPDGVFTIYGDMLLQPAGFADLEAEPIWDSQYHELVLLETYPLAAELMPKDPKAAALLAEFAHRYPVLRRAFVSRYLPSVRCAGPML